MRNTTLEELAKKAAEYRGRTALGTLTKEDTVTKIRERAKFDAWAGNKGTSKDDAMTKYMALVDTLA